MLKILKFYKGALNQHFTIVYIKDSGSLEQILEIVLIYGICMQSSNQIDSYIPYIFKQILINNDTYLNKLMV